MFCSKCGTKLREGDIFCSNCGTKNIEGKEGIIVKILYSIPIVIVFFIWNIISVLIAYDNFMSEGINVILSFTSFILILLVIWKEKNRNIKMTLIIVLVILARIGHGYYYFELSVERETLYHLHKEYGFEYKDMEIIDKYNATSDFITPGTNRNAIIKYKNRNISVWYNSAGYYWEDNYKKLMEYNEQTKKIYEEVSSIIKKYSNNVILLEDLQITGNLEECGYNNYGLIIFLYNENNDINEKIINELDMYISKYDCKYLMYGLFIVKDLKLYNKMIEKDISSLNTNNTGSCSATDPQEVLEKMNYKYEMITRNEGYNENIFTNNGDILDEKYKNPNNFENIVFHYDSGKNSVLSNNTDFMVFGING